MTSNIPSFSSSHDKILSSLCGTCEVIQRLTCECERGLIETRARILSAKLEVISLLEMSLRNAELPNE